MEAITAERIVEFLVFYTVLLFSLSFHEAAHAISAKWGGDHTAAYQGRITMNPLAHIDPIGTVLLPILMFFSGVSFLIGWAKPVMVQELNFRRSNWGMIVALAGPFSNIILAVCGMIMLQAVAYSAVGGGEPSKVLTTVLDFLQYFVVMNCALALFNMLPIPPLDGSHVLWHTFVKRHRSLWPLFETVQQYGFFLLMALFAFTPLRSILSAGIFFLMRILETVTSLGIPR